MACCGQKREAWLPAAEAGSQNNGEAPASRPDVSFEYTGETGLTVTGSITRRQYRFSGKGNRQSVDYRDGPGMMAVPMLKRIRD